MVNIKARRVMNQSSRVCVSCIPGMQRTLDLRDVFSSPVDPVAGQLQTRPWITTMDDGHVAIAPSHAEWDLIFVTIFPRLKKIVTRQFFLNFGRLLWKYYGICLGRIKIYRSNAF